MLCLVAYRSDNAVENRARIHHHGAVIVTCVFGRYKVSHRQFGKRSVYARTVGHIFDVKFGQCTSHFLGFVVCVLLGRLRHSTLKHRTCNIMKSLYIKRCIFSLAPIQNDQSIFETRYGIRYSIQIQGLQSMEYSLLSRPIHFCGRFTFGSCEATQVHTRDNIGLDVPRGTNRTR